MNKTNKISVIAGGLLLSGGLIAGLASAAVNAHSKKHDHSYSDHMGHGGKHFKAKRLDTNKDGVISLEELLAGNMDRFQKLDADSDGTLTLDEFNAKMVTMFTKMDVNGDGMISTDERPKRHHKGKHYHRGEMSNSVTPTS